MSGSILFVGWETAPSSQPIPEEFVPAAKRGKTEAETREEWVKEYHDSPYGGSLRRVMLIDPLGMAQEFTTEKTVIYPGGWPKKSPVPPAAQAGAWLRAHYGGATSPVFFGFEPRRFVKHLGLECARLRTPLPSSLWYATSDYRDAEGAILPEPFAKHMSLAVALQSFGLSATGFTPGRDAKADAVMAMRIALALGLVDGNSFTASLQAASTEVTEESASEV